MSSANLAVRSRPTSRSTGAALPVASAGRAATVSPPPVRVNPPSAIVWGIDPGDVDRAADRGRLAARPRRDPVRLDEAPREHRVTDPGVEHRDDAASVDRHRKADLVAPASARTAPSASLRRSQVGCAPHRAAARARRQPAPARSGSISAASTGNSVRAGPSGKRLQAGFEERLVEPELLGLFERIGAQTHRAIFADDLTVGGLVEIFELE